MQQPDSAEYLPLFARNSSKSSSQDSLTAKEETITTSSPLSVNVAVNSQQPPPPPPPQHLQTTAIETPSITSTIPITTTSAALSLSTGDCLHPPPPPISSSTNATQPPNVAYNYNLQQQQQHHQQKSPSFSSNGSSSASSVIASRRPSSGGPLPPVQYSYNAQVISKPPIAPDVAYSYAPPPASMVVAVTSSNYHPHHQQQQLPPPPPHSHYSSTQPQQLRQQIHTARQQQIMMQPIMSSSSSSSYHYRKQGYSSVPAPPPPTSYSQIDINGSSYSNINRNTNDKMPLGTLPPRQPNTPRFAIIIRQQPQRARMCGCGDKDRRTIDPPPIVEIIRNDPEDPENLFKPITADNPYYVVRCSLWTTDGETEIRRSDRVPKELSILIGSIAEPAQVLLDEFGRPGCFAVFADMSVRIEGDFMLRFSVVDIGSNSKLTGGNGRVLCETFSNTFVVMAPKEFPGMLPSSKLSKSLRDQGVKMLVRKDRKSELSQSRKNSTEADDSD